MKYVFVLGRHPSLSVAEIARTIPGAVIEAVENGFCLINCEELAENFLNRLGGTIKITKVAAELRDLRQIDAALLRKTLPAREGRVIFGISVYGRLNGPERRAIYMEGLALKKAIKDEGRRCRYVVSRETQLSSVVVAKNKLIEEGAEFIVVAMKNKVLLATTQAVQEFEAYGERDFDRPGRSARRGMLPPKLSQMMVNIASGDKKKILLDPFCGSGTVLGEALLLGYENVVGSDLSAEAVADSKAYLEWLEKAHPEFNGRWRVFGSDARRIDQQLPAGSIGAIASEPLLGPPQSGHETPDQLKKIMNEQLAPLYREALASIEKILAPGANAVFSFPVFGRNKFPVFVPLDSVRGNLVAAPLIPGEYQSFNLPMTSAGGVLYERPDQHVAREIVLLKKA